MKEYKDEKGFYHKEDGPAYEGTNGTKEWRVHGKMHREDGPAVEWANGCKGWYDKGIWIMDSNGPVTEAQVKEFRLRKII